MKNLPQKWASHTKNNPGVLPGTAENSRVATINFWGQKSLRKKTGACLKTTAQ